MQPGVVRVTVASHSRSLDLVLPSAVPVAELVPELARVVGLLDPTLVHGGYRVLTPGGRRLEDDASLAGQGVEDGALLTVAAGIDAAGAPRYDDPVEAMADVLAERVPSWPMGAGRRAGLGALVLLLALALAGQVLGAGVAAGWGGSAGAATATAVSLLGCGVGLARWWRAPDAAVVLVWASVGHAALAGALLAPVATGQPGVMVATAGAGGLAAALSALAGLPGARLALVPAALLGGLALVAGWLSTLAPAGPLITGATLLAASVAAGGLSPRLAVAAARLDAGAGTRDGEPLGTGAVDLAEIESDGLLAHRIVVALEVTLGLLLVALAPLVAALGPAGAALGLCCCAVVLLRARRFRAAALVATCLGFGALATAATLTAVLVQHAGARAPLAVVLLVAGAALSASLPHAALAWHRVAGAAESCCLIALIPLLVAAAGALGRVAQVLGSVAG